MIPAQTKSMPLTILSPSGSCCLWSKVHLHSMGGGWGLFEKLCVRRDFIVAGTPPLHHSWSLASAAPSWTTSASGTFPPRLLSASEYWPTRQFLHSISVPSKLYSSRFRDQTPFLPPHRLRTFARAFQISAAQLINILVNPPNWLLNKGRFAWQTLHTQFELKEFSYLADNLK